MTEDIEKSHTFATIEMYFYKRYKKIESCYDLYSKEYQEAVKQELKLLSRICNLKQRNQPLAKYIYLKAMLFPLEGFDKLAAKRGKKLDSYDMPTKAIMKALDCTRRTASDYQNALRADREIDEYLNLCYAAAVMAQGRKTETQNDTVTPSAAASAEAQP